MNKRRMDIINDLSNLERVCTIGQLTEKYGVSSRTIRNDLSAINELLAEGNLSPVTLRKGGEIYCCLDFVGVLDFVKAGDYYDYKLSKEERVKIAAVLMVQSEDFITLSAIADNLFVSRTTIIEELYEIKKGIILFAKNTALSVRASLAALRNMCSCRRKMCASFLMK